jgi:molecular chaperone DnaK (HSP70)
MDDLNEILCRMRLDLDGILEVTSQEKSTGKSKRITIANAMQAKTPEEIAAGRKRIQELFESRAGGFEDDADLDADEADDGAESGILEGEVADRTALPGEAEAETLMARSRGLLERMHEEDREEAIDLHERIEEAIEAGDAAALVEASRALTELLFFMEGQIGGRPN